MEKSIFYRVVLIAAAIAVCNIAVATAQTDASAKQIYERRSLNGDDLPSFDGHFTGMSIPAYDSGEFALGAISSNNMNEAARRYRMLVRPDMSAFRKMKVETFDANALRDAALRALSGNTAKLGPVTISASSSVWLPQRTLRYTNGPMRPAYSGHASHASPMTRPSRLR